MTEFSLLGIDVGSTNLKICGIDRDGQVCDAVLPHEGDIDGTMRQLLEQLGIGDDHSNCKALATGTEGRHRFQVPETIAPLSVETGLEHLNLKPQAVVSLGGEDLVVYLLGDNGRISSTYSGNKCASGTGEFFRQQLGRMNLDLSDLDEAATGATTCKLSARCSVFMKSDCTHRLNKGESTVGDIALSLSKVMADKVSDFLTKARVNSGQVVLIGGVTQNRHIKSFLEESWPGVEFVVPKEAPFFEAFGAAVLAAEMGGQMPPAGDLVNEKKSLSYPSYPPMSEHEAQVRYVPSLRGRYDPGASYILGVDGGSTTTKVALINAKTHEIVAAHYGRTHGDPVGAFKECLEEVKKQIAGASPKIQLVSTTGSSRELLGVFIETPAVYNEIIAHTVGTTYFESNVDTIFEIGGQDAKYVYINNGVPIDYAMNEACSAGTGSFLEESARGDLNISEAKDIGPIAVEAASPLRFGEHCSAFINSDIRKAIGQGASREDIVSGLVFSIVSNYLNRVVGNRYMGEHIVLQGGVAKNPAVPLAFAKLTGKNITVPPDPELMGCFGVGLLAQQKMVEGFLQEGSYDFETLLSKEIISKGTFICKSCSNYCEIRRLEVGGAKYPFGGRCSKFTNLRKKKKIDEEHTVDYTKVRSEMIFETYAPDPATLVPRTDKTVGVPMAFSTHSLWPLYSWFFHTLGVRIVPSTAIDPEGIAKLESNYCFPAEIAHGAVQDIINKNTDYLFLPLFRDMESMEENPGEACTCPLTQGLPFFSRQAFNLDESRILKPLVAFKHGALDSEHSFTDVARALGFKASEGKKAYRKATFEYGRFLDAYRQLGKQVIAQVKSDPSRLYMALMGRPYNAFTQDANMGIPRKFVSQGITVIPFDMIYDEEAEIFPNMYWYYGQQNMKAVRQVKGIDNLYLTWVSNFSCAPDSFMLHYLRWMMGQKPYLVLEIDSHSADAGIDTRIEAFIDIIESYRKLPAQSKNTSDGPRFEIIRKKEYLDVLDHRTGERIDIKDPRVTLIWPSMGDLAAELAAASTQKAGIKSTYLPVPDHKTIELARNVASGKECIPALLVLGSILQFLDKHPPNREGEIYLVLIPSTIGPCRTGQYHVFYEQLFKDLGWENVIVVVGSSENSYREFGPSFTKDLWRSLVLADYFTDMRIGLRLMAKDESHAMQVFEGVWKEIVAGQSRSTKAVEQAVKKAQPALGAIERERRVEEIPKVLIVGEIYVRRDTFSVGEISNFLIDKGIFPKVTGITEWVNYTDYSRKYLMDQARSRDGFWKSLGSGLFKDKALYHIEQWYKDKVEHEVQSRLGDAGLVPTVPHDMKQIVGTAKEHFIDPELESEATVSSGVAAEAMMDGFAGVAIIAPFACLPGRLIEGVFAPWAKRRGYPVISLENDGQPYPPNVQSRMEIFAHNVVRFDKQKRERG